MQVVFVCTGNICRSPLAEAIARRLLDERGRPDIEVSSAGTAAFDGSPASEGAYLVALENGLDLSSHVSTPLSPEVVTEADLVLGMAPHHVERARVMGGEEKSYLLGEYAGRPPGDDHVEDPYGGDLEEYRRTYAQLAALMEVAVERIVKEYPAPAEQTDE
jgi:protein-tyrosine phosphatase